MMRISSLVLGGLMLSAIAFADGIPKINLVVGKPQPFSPGYASIQTVCDDTSVVRVSDGGNTLILTGLKVGTTQCGFYRDAGFRNVYQVVVEAPKTAR